MCPAQSNETDFSEKTPNSQFSRESHPQSSAASNTREDLTLSLPADKGLDGHIGNFQGLTESSP